MILDSFCQFQWSLFTVTETSQAECTVCHPAGICDASTIKNSQVKELYSLSPLPLCFPFGLWWTVVKPIPQAKIITRVTGEKSIGQWCEETVSWQCCAMKLFVRGINRSFDCDSNRILNGESDPDSSLHPPRIRITCKSSRMIILLLLWAERCRLCIILITSFFEEPVRLILSGDTETSFLQETQQAQTHLVTFQWGST